MRSSRSLAPRVGVAVWTAVGTYGLGTYFYGQADGSLGAYDAAMRRLWRAGPDAIRVPTWRSRTPGTWSSTAATGPVGP
ncbi:hypothetical protein [Streptomyces niveus]|uniref:hypothetical protein n=1 Tax=Streptomyces niveus TaxID=193462 RepID=UPI000A810BFA|nr:hypothetical protein [Streptomyces niveus]